MRAWPCLAAPVAALALGIPSPARADDSTDPEPGDRKNWTRTLEEYVVVNGVVGMPWYWGNQDWSQKTWDWRWDRESWKAKLITFDAVRFDGDDFRTNAVHHTFVSGMSYFVIARANRLSIGESFLASVLASTTWEYLVEFREGPSVNDMITTPLSGLALGETFYQLGELFLRGGDHPVNWVLGTGFGGLSSLHRRIDRTAQPKSVTVDTLGIAQDVWHRFGLHAAIQLADLPTRSETRMQLGLDTEIVTVRGFGKAGTFARTASGEGFSQLTVRFTQSEAGVQEVFVRARATLGGHYRQDLRGEHARRGHAFYAGLVATYDYAVTTLDTWTDRAGISGVGLTMDAFLLRPPLFVRATADATADFAMVTPAAGDAYRARLPAGARTRPSFLVNDYYYAVGATVRTAVHVLVRPFYATFEARLDAFSSIDGLERRQWQVTHDDPFADRRLTHRVTVGVEPVPLLRLFGAFERRARDGSVGAVDVDHRERIFTVGASLTI